jgi:copper resistance protein C
MKMALAAVTAVFFVLAGTSIAHAHASLVSSNPEDGSALSMPPTSVELTFNEELLPDTVEIAVTTEAAGLITGTEFTTVGPTVQVTWPRNLPNDTYKVAYRVVSNDGHPITGAISFSYTGSDAPANLESANMESEVIVTDSTEVQEEAQDEVQETESAGIAPVWLIIGGLVIGTGIGYFMWRRASKRASS